MSGDATDVPRELADDPRARRLVAELCLRRIPLHPEAPAWLERTAAERGALPPAGVICDLGAILHGASPEGEETAPEGPLRRAVRAYEDRVLGTFTHGRHLVPLRDALARATPEEQVTAVALVAAAVCDRLLGAEGHAVPQSLWRRLARMPSAVLEAWGHEVLRHDHALVIALAEAYERLVDAARSRASLVDAADVFVVEHVAALAELGQRVAVGQIAAAADAMARRWPRRLESRKRREGSTATTMEDESTYPTGGFAAVARASGVTNLVPSELIYMEGDRVAGTVDAFDVRYAEAALLHYVRDEGFIARPRRHLLLVVDGTLVDARVKDPGVPFQRGVIALGWLLAATREVERRLSREALQLTVTFTGEPAALTALEPERQLAAISLRDWSDKGLLTLEATPPEAIVPQACLATRSADTRVAWLGAPPPAVAVALDEEGILWAALPLAARSWDAWCDEGAALLASLL